MGRQKMKLKKNPSFQELSWPYYRLILPEYVLPILIRIEAGFKMRYAIFSYLRYENQLTES